MSNLTPSHYPDIGQLGEDLVAQWLQTTFKLQEYILAAFDSSIDNG